MPLEFPGALTGAGPNVEVLDPGGAPNTIIDTDDNFTVRVRWSIDLPGASLLGGQFLVRAYAESVGPGVERQIGPIVARNVNTGTLGGPPARLDYVADVGVAAGTLTAEEPASSGGPESSGVYKLVVIVTHQNFGGATVLAGFSEGPIIQMRNP
jgi:hypothetical protein